MNSPWSRFSPWLTSCGLSDGAVVRRLSVILAVGLVVTLAGGAGCSWHGRGAAVVLGADLSGFRVGSGDWHGASSVGLDPANPRRLLAPAGRGMVVNGPDGKTRNLLTEAEFGDAEVHLEFLISKDSNSGVYFMGRYEVQVFDSHGKAEVKSSDCGGLYASCSDPKPDWPGRPPSSNASRAPGEWQSLDAVFRAPRFGPDGRKVEPARFVKVTLNGRVIHENIEVPRPTCAAWQLDERAVGPLMLQGDHGPVAYRNLRLRALRLP